MKIQGQKVVMLENIHLDCCIDFFLKGKPIACSCKMHSLALIACF